MRVLRGRAETPEADRERTAAMLDHTAETGEPTVRVWRPHRQLAFGRRDARAEGYESAAAAAREHDFEPFERSVGGRAVAYTGTTVAFARTVPLDDIRTGLEERYDETTEMVQRALWRLDVPAQRGEPEASFCPGNHSLQWKGKLVGVAQRVRKGSALVGGVVLVADHEEIAGVLEPVYRYLDVPFDPDSVGSIERAGGRTDHEVVMETVETALVGERETEPLDVGEESLRSG